MIVIIMICDDSYHDDCGNGDGSYHDDLWRNELIMIVMIVIMMIISVDRSKLIYMMYLFNIDLSILVL